MARTKNTVTLDTSAFDGIIKQIQDLGGDVRGAVDMALEQAAETIREDTYEALEPANLPAGGKYSTGQTRESVITDNKVHWSGSIGWIPVGFDYLAPGAGGFLISGTPKMKPDMALRKMYKPKKYMSEIQNDIKDVLEGELMIKLEGG